MAVRIKDGIIPYTGDIGIEITDNHVINVLLRAMNNLIMVNEDRELYVDLQLPDDIAPDDDFPVGVTTGRILQENGWIQSGTILSWETTSGDYARIIYGNDGKLYYNTNDDDPNVWHEFAVAEDVNTKTFYLPASTSELGEVNNAYDWYKSGKDPILWFNNQMYTFGGDYTWATTPYLEFVSTDVVNTEWENEGTATIGADKIKLYIDSVEDAISSWEYISHLHDTQLLHFVPTDNSLRVPFIPTEDSHPATKKYVDDGLATKQDILVEGANIHIDPNTNVISADNTTYTAGQHIDITNGVISADLSGALVYKGNVSDVSDLANIQNPSIGDTYFVEGADVMYSWDGNQWNQVGGTGIDLTNFFNKVNDDSDDIIQGNSHLFCTNQEKAYWNAKQEQIIAGDNITINADGKTINAVDTKYTAGDNINISNKIISSPSYTGGAGISVSNYQISNTKPFDPENQGVISQVLKRTSTGYKWSAESAPVTSVNGRTGDVLVDEFLPDNAGITGQVLKKTSEGYQWSDESVKSVNGETGNVTIDGFDPENDGSVGQVLKKTSTGYKWQNESSGGGGGGSSTRYYGGDYISIDSSNYINNDAPFTPGAGSNGQVLTKTSGGYAWRDGFKPESNGSTGQVLTRTSTGYDWTNSGAGGDSNVKLFTINSSTDYTNATAAYNWLQSGKLAILKFRNTYGQYPKTADYYYYPVIDSTSTSNNIIFEAQITTNNYMLLTNGRVRPSFPRLTFTVSNSVVTAIEVSTSTASRTETVRSWIGTQAEYDAIPHETDVVYNIIPSS